MMFPLRGAMNPLGRAAGKALTAYTLTLQPDGAAGVDTMLDQVQPTLNSGTSPQAHIGNGGAGTGIQRQLIKFDLSSIPSNAIVTSAVLSLWLYYDQANQVSTVTCYRQLKAWVESQATWNIWKTGSNWTTAGGFDAADCEQAGIGSRNMTASESAGEKQWVLNPSKVQEWISGTLTNNGLLMKSEAETDRDYYAYRSSDYTTAEQRPKLVIEYLA